ncbi:MAG TPA: hypothetical protein ENN21_05165 [Spirochaetes bacterium]|nr:hypothetical protein [Spirochaetota bacterium]
MEILSKILFYGVIPGVIVYFRVKKKYGTAFAIGMAATSLLMGLIVSRTFMPTPAERLVELINDNRYEEAKEQLRYIAQKDPGEVKKIDAGRVLNPVMFERIKRELSSYYLSVAGGIAEKAEIKKEYSRGDEAALKKTTASLEHALRLIDMAENLGAEDPAARRRILSSLERIKTEKAKLERGSPGK